METTTKSTEQHEYCPTQGGVFTAYAPEFFDGTAWKRIPTLKNNGGIPTPVMNGGVINTIGLFGYEQAQALAWAFASLSVASYDTQKTEVRVQAYEVFYDIKARKIDVAPAASA